MRSSVRWLVPVAVAATVAGGVAVSSAQAGDSPDLPQRSPEQVLASVASSSVRALSGTVVTRADIGLPALDSLTGAGAGPGASASADDPAGLLSRFLTGKNTLRVWADGATRQRVQLLDRFNELDVVRNGSQVWAYTSRGNVVQQGTLPARPARPGTSTASPSPSGTAADLTPDQLARKAVEAADPTTAVTLGSPALVAGRDAYSLTLTPRTDATLVGRIVIAVDAANGVPLRVQVFPRGKAQAAIETGFTSVDFATPAASQFTFTPPPGAKVEPFQAPKLPEAKTGTARPQVPAADRPTVTGTGWASIVEVPASALRDLQAHAQAVPKAGTTVRPQHKLTPPTDTTGEGLAVLDGIAAPAGDGGRAISTSLVSVLFTKDGRVLAGAVPVQALVDAAAR